MPTTTRRSREAQRLGYAEADPTEDVSGADAAAKMAILATVAFGSRVGLEDVVCDGIERIRPDHVRAAHELGMAVRLIGSATLLDDAVDVRVEPAFVDRRHPLAAVEGPFNAVMLQGDAIREITLEGPGAGGLATASAVVADMVSVIGTTGTGFLQNDACWRTLERLPAGDLRSPFYLQHRGRRPAGRARPRRRAPGGRGRLDRPPDAAAAGGAARHSTSSRTTRRRDECTPRRPRSRSSPRCTASLR